MEQEQVVHMAAAVSARMLCWGAEVHRVEETARRICAAYGMEAAHVFAVPACVIITIEKDGKTLTETRRIEARSTNLDRVDRLNSLARRICRDRPGYEEICREIQAVETASLYPEWLIVLACGIAAGAFALLFGGNWKDGIAAFLAGGGIRLLLRLLRRAGAGGFFSVLLCSAAAGVFSFAGEWILPGANHNMIIIGAIMTLVPGLTFTNSIRDFIVNDYMAGLASFAEALLTATAIAAGVSAVLLLFHAPAEMNRQEAVQAVFWSCVYAFTGAAGFCVLFQIHRRNLLAAALGGLLGWLCYKLMAGVVAGDIWRYLLAAVLVSTYAEILARVNKAPATVFLIVGVIPLVPGAAVYRTMENCIQGDVNGFLAAGLYTLQAAGAIALGVAAVSAAARVIAVSRRCLKKR